MVGKLREVNAIRPLKNKGLDLGLLPLRLFIEFGRRFPSSPLRIFYIALTVIACIAEFFIIKLRLSR